jgi:hypothetical protein
MLVVAGISSKLLKQKETEINLLKQDRLGKVDKINPKGKEVEKHYGGYSATI